MKRSREYWRNKWRRRAARFKARRLTTRGTKPKIRLCPEVKIHGPLRKRLVDRLRYQEKSRHRKVAARVEIGWRLERDSMGVIEVKGLTESVRLDNQELYG